MTSIFPQPESILEIGEHFQIIGKLSFSEIPLKNLFRTDSLEITSASSARELIQLAQGCVFLYRFPEISIFAVQAIAFVN